MRDKIILVTGGTGSFGQAFIREALSKNPRQVRVLSRDELKQSQMKEAFNDPRIDYLLGDVRDYERLVTALEGVDIVVHAAALKRIEKGETDSQEFVKTNILGTMNVANACLKNNVKSAILISTDKAAYPVNLYGATKLTAEKVWNQSNVYRGNNKNTKFSVVRYGNVLGSRGSVINAFREQEVLKVTDSEMTRFFITLQQAIELVQLAIETQQGGEIYLPELKAVSILRLAGVLAGKKPITITNKRGGEKLHETLITKEESERSEIHNKYVVVHPEITTWPYIKQEDCERAQFVTSQMAEHFTDKELSELLGTSA